MLKLTQRYYVPALFVLSLVFMLAVSTAGADTVYGTNSVLNNNNDELYIPFKPSSSGTLGQNGTIGLTRDSVTLYRDGETTQGYVSFVLDFDLSGLIPAGEELSFHKVLFDFDDMDFKKYNVSNVIFGETMELSFLFGSNDTPPATVDIEVDENNYENYVLNGNPPTQTNNADLTYEFDLKDDFGLTDLDIDTIASNEGFSLFVTYYTEIEHTRYRRSGDTVGNSPEGMMARFSFDTQPGVPEPATLSLMGLGVAALIRRKRK